MEKDPSAGPGIPGPLEVKHYHVFEEAYKKVDEDTNKLRQYLNSGLNDSLEFRLLNALKGIANCHDDLSFEHVSLVSKLKLREWHSLLTDIRAALRTQKKAGCE